MFKTNTHKKMRNITCLSHLTLAKRLNRKVLFVWLCAFFMWPNLQFEFHFDFHNSFFSCTCHIKFSTSLFHVCYMCLYETLNFSAILSPPPSPHTLVRGTNIKDFRGNKKRCVPGRSLDFVVVVVVELTFIL